MYIITISFVELYKLNLQVPPATINDTNLSRIFNIEAMFDCIVPFQLKKKRKNSVKKRKETLKKNRKKL